jgi:hypothetical protein
MLAGRTRFAPMAALAAIVAFGAAAHTQQLQYSKPTELPNPYRLVEGWPTLPKSMNGGHWGEVIRVSLDLKGNIWVFHRCFNTVPPGHATCVGRGDSDPPILEFDPSGKLLKSFGVGLFAYPHGFTIDGDGNFWASDVNDEPMVLGMSAKNSNGVIRGQEVLKLSPDGKVLMMLGKEGVAGNGPDTFDRPTGVAVAPNGDIFVTDGHLPNKYGNARVVKFAKDGRFIKTWGHLGAGPGEFDEPHDIFIGGSQGRVFVADRRNRRVQVFDQDGNFIAAWTQFGQPSSVFVGKNDTIYVGASFPNSTAEKGEKSHDRSWSSQSGRQGETRGIMIGSAKDGSLTAFIPDPADPDHVDVGTSASGIVADDMATIYAADVGPHNLRKYVKVK